MRAAWKAKKPSGLDCLLKIEGDGADPADVRIVSVYELEESRAHNVVPPTVIRSVRCTPGDLGDKDGGIAFG
jgi:hypothetical protein